MNLKRAGITLNTENLDDCIALKRITGLVIGNVYFHRFFTAARYKSAH
jgi:hypothetical protein